LYVEVNAIYKEMLIESKRLTEALHRK